VFFVAEQNCIVMPIASFSAVRELSSNVDDREVGSLIQPANPDALQQLAARVVAGETAALARAISLAENDAAASRELLSLLPLPAGAALRIGITGAPGAGKSTLVEQLARRYAAEQKVAVLAIDPTSPITGGALLGDRIRMQGVEQQVYVRSMATRGFTGGLARAAADACRLMEAAGRSPLLIETVGVGQEETEVVRLADVTVVVLTPGMGDDVQSMKAGLMEVADIFVINKSDREGAERLHAELQAMQSLAEAGAWQPPIVRTVATSGEGMEELQREIARCAAWLRDGGRELRFSARENYASLFPGETCVLDHLGIAVHSIAAARKFYEQIGLHISGEEIVPQEKVRVAMLPLGATRLELLEPTAEDSVIAKFLLKRGEGLHHVALRVSDIDATFARLRGSVRLVREEIGIGAGGHKYFFVHPASAGGVLVEVVGQS